MRKKFNRCGLGTIFVLDLLLRLLGQRGSEEFPLVVEDRAFDVPPLSNPLISFCSNIGLHRDALQQQASSQP